ncbi:hypothetical protein Trydic_g2762 [Trypoxylus dichotomus]
MRIIWRRSRPNASISTGVDVTNEPTNYVHKCFTSIRFCYLLVISYDAEGYGTLTDLAILLITRVLTILLKVDVCENNARLNGHRLGAHAKIVLRQLSPFMLLCFELLTFALLTFSSSICQAGIQRPGSFPFVLDVKNSKGVSTRTAVLILPEVAVTTSKDFDEGSTVTGVLDADKVHTSTVRTLKMPGEGSSPLRVIELLKPFPLGTKTIPILTRVEAFHELTCWICSFENRPTQWTATLLRQQECEDAQGTKKGEMFCATAKSCFRANGAMLLCEGLLMGVRASTVNCPDSRKFGFVNVAVFDSRILKAAEKFGYSQETTAKERSTAHSNSRNVSVGSAALVLPEIAVTAAGDTLDEEGSVTGILPTGREHTSRVRVVALSGWGDYPLRTMELVKPFPSGTPTIPLVTRFEGFFHMRCTIFYFDRDVLKQKATLIDQYDCKESAGAKKGHTFCVTAAECFKSFGALLLCEGLLMGVRAEDELCPELKKFGFHNVAISDSKILRASENYGYLEEESVRQRSTAYPIGQCDLTRNIFFFTLFCIVNMYS